MRRLAWILPLLLPLMTGGIAIGVERFPPPEFTSGYELPQTDVDQTLRTTAGDWAMLATMAALLAAATYYAVKSRSRIGILGTAVASIALLGFLCEGCVCSIGAIQNVAWGLFDNSFVLPLAVIGMFSLPLVVALFFGRTFCSSVCPLGALQELVALRPLKIPRWVDDSLGLMRYAYLGLAVLLAATGTMMIICKYDPFVGFFRLSGSFAILAFGGVLLLLGVFVARPYCRFLCPYGGLLALCSRLASHPARISPDECVSCRLCEDACPYNAIQGPSVPPPADVKRRGRTRLAVMLLLLPLVLLLGVWAGSMAADPLSMLHPTVKTAETVRMEQLGLITDETPTAMVAVDENGPVGSSSESGDRAETASTVTLEGLVEAGDIRDAFAETGRPVEDLYNEAFTVRRRFRWGGLAFGAWLGLVFGIKLVQLSTRRKRETYQLDPGRCFACGRCFMHCPVEHVRRGLIARIEDFRPPGKS